MPVEYKVKEKIIEDSQLLERGKKEFMCKNVKRAFPRRDRIYYKSNKNGKQK